MQQTFNENGEQNAQQTQEETKEKKLPPYGIAEGQEEEFEKGWRERFAEVALIFATHPSFKFFYDNVVVPKLKETIEEKKDQIGITLDILTLGFMYSEMLESISEREAMQGLEQIKSLIEGENNFFYDATLSDGNTVTIMTNKEIDEAEAIERINSAKNGLTYAGGFRQVTAEEIEEKKKQVLNAMNDENVEMHIEQKELEQAKEEVAEAK